MLKRSLLAIKIIFFLLLFCFLIEKSLQRPRILVVQSYANDFSWTRDIDRAIKRELSNKNYHVRYFYMDTKKHSGSVFKKKAGSQIKKQIDTWSPDVLIAVDDNAQSLVSACYVNMAQSPLTVIERKVLKESLPDLGKCYQAHPQMKIVFAGVGASPKEYGFIGQRHIGGILDPVDAVFISDSFEKIKQQMEKTSLRVMAPVDDSNTSQHNMKNSLYSLKKALRPYDIYLEYKVTVTWHEWKKQIEQANEQADLLLFTLYHTVKCSVNIESKRIAPRDLIQWTLANTKIPAIGTYGFFVEDGGLFSIAVSPAEQGVEAAKLVMDYLERGIWPGDQSYRSTHQSIIFMREHRAKKQGFDLPVVYRNFALATGSLITQCKDASKGCTVESQPPPDLQGYCNS
ncbi:hypothetical protein JYU12_01145 [bacterium AH-315-K03]|nr:hypothetical protein [bacterium AH-315-K03]